MTPEERGNRAQQLLNEQCVQEAFADMRDRFVKRLESPMAGDTVSEHELVLSLQLLVGLRRQLMAYEQERVIIEHKKSNDSFVAKATQKIRTFKAW